MRNNPKTSFAAYESVKKEVISNHQSKIIEAISIIKSGTYEEIAIFLKWDDKNRAARRLSELERLQKVYKTGEKRKTKSGRDAYVYRLLLVDQKSVQTTLF